MILVVLIFTAAGLTLVGIKYRGELRGASHNWREFFHPHHFPNKKKMRQF